MRAARAPFSLTSLPVTRGGGPPTLPGGLPRGSGPRVYVGGVPTAVSETMVRAHFSQWGAVLDVYFPKDRVTGRRKNYCFVTFGSPAAAENAAARSNREIGRFRVEAISVTRDRATHYEAVQRATGRPAGLDGSGGWGMEDGAGGGEGDDVGATVVRCREDGGFWVAWVVWRGVGAGCVCGRRLPFHPFLP